MTRGGPGRGIHSVFAPGVCTRAAQNLQLVVGIQWVHLEARVQNFTFSACSERAPSCGQCGQCEGEGIAAAAVVRRARAVAAAVCRKSFTAHRKREAKGARVRAPLVRRCACRRRRGRGRNFLQRALEVPFSGGRHFREALRKPNFFPPPAALVRVDGSQQFGPCCCRARRQWWWRRRQQQPWWWVSLWSFCGSAALSRHSRILFSQSEPSSSSFLFARGFPFCCRVRDSRGGGCRP